MALSSEKLVSAVLTALFLAVGLPALAAETDAYHLGQGDKIRVTIHEVPNPAAEYTLTADGSIVLPLLGEVLVSGKTVPELRREVTAALIEGDLLRRATVAIEILARRPFYISGAVVTPGAYEYRPGLTVRQALALAGGVATVRPGTGLEETRDVLRLQGEHDALATELLHLVARACRLEARVAGAETIDFTALGPLSQSSGAARVMALERQQFAAEDARLQEAQRLTAGLLAQSEDEIRTLRLRIANLENGVALQRKEFEAMQALFRQGLVPTSRMHELERLSARLQDDHLDVMARSARAEREHIELQHRLDQLRADQRMEATRQLQDTRLRIEQVQAMLSSVKGRLGMVALPGSAGADTDGAASVVVVAVHRADKDGERTLRATPLTLVAPGDVVDVSVNPQAVTLGRNPQY